MKVKALPGVADATKIERAMPRAIMVGKYEEEEKMTSTFRSVEIIFNQREFVVMVTQDILKMCYFVLTKEP